MLNPRDQLHEKARSASRELTRVRLLTTEMVLDEVLAALSKPIVRSVAIQGVKAILNDPNVEVVPQTSLKFREALHLYAGRIDKAWRLTDCASFTLMQDRGITESLAHDEHFEQAGFVALLMS